MCGRYGFSTTIQDDKLQAIVKRMDKQYPGSYKTGEIFPGDTVPAIIQNNGHIVPVPAVFGFPGFQNGRLLINARSETAAEKATFSHALRSTRTILPATGFYEWAHDSEKTKYYLTIDSQPIIYLCGIYRIIEGTYRFVILTRPANESMTDIHDRMPVIAAAEEVRPYLENYEYAVSLLASASPELTRQDAREVKV